MTNNRPHDPPANDTTVSSAPPPEHHDAAAIFLATCLIESDISSIFTNGFTYTYGFATVVDNLPGFPCKLPFKLETGYIGVGKSEEIQLFYYFIESESSPENDPLLLWLNGGPGCSGFYALIYEFGPINFDYANSDGEIPALVLNPSSWTKVASIIFLDQPVGTGFSYGKTQDAYKNNDTLSAKSTYEFLKKWLINHPKYLKNPLYIGGGSYSGITVPLVVNEVYNGIEAGSKPLLNIKGYILENPFTDILRDYNGRVAYAHRMGLLSDELYLSAKENCKGNYASVNPDNHLCKDDLKRMNQCVEKITKEQILEPWCDTVEAEKQDLLLHHHMPSYEDVAGRFLQSIPLHAESWCRTMNMPYSYKWANIKLVQKALHVREGTITEWVRCNATITYIRNYNRPTSYTYNVNSTVDYHKKFTHKGCRALIYSGDHDLIAPHTSTEEWIKSLKLFVQSDWRPWFVEGQVAGYTTAYFHGNYELIYATVKGAGHTPPEYKPLECFRMIERWFRHSPL